MCWHGISCKISWGTDGAVLQEIRLWFAHRPVDDSYFVRYTIGKKLTRTACKGGKCEPPGGLACLGSTMESIKALHHANAHLVRPVPNEVRVGNKQRCVHRLTNTTGSVLTYIAQRGCAHVPPEVLARLGSSIASMGALDHAHGPRLVSFRNDARQANKRRWFI